MKPLFQTFFCDVNECDLPVSKRRPVPRKTTAPAPKPISWYFTSGVPGRVLPPAYCTCTSRFVTMHHNGKATCLACNLEIQP